MCNVHTFRCIFNMDQQQASLDNGTMESLVNRDVLNNVFKNGQWGSYRHVPLDSGTFVELIQIHKAA